MSDDLNNAREVLSAYDDLVDDLRDENARLREALTDMLAQAGWANFTDAELREEERLGNGKAPILLRAREALNGDMSEASMSDVREALAALVNRLDEIHADPVYKSVWTVNQIHAGPYTGPTYVEALARARAALATVTAPTKSE